MISVIIPVGVADYERLGLQLTQLERQQTNREFEVVIGDNGGTLTSPDGPFSFDVRVLDASATRGSSFARNLAVSGAKGDHLLFCDADDFVGPQWIEAMVATLDHTPFCAGSRLTVAASDQRIDDVMKGWWPDIGFSSRAVKHERISIAPSCNLGVARSCFEQVGGFPLEYLRSQDVAFSLALRKIGVTPHFTPEAEIVYVVGTRSRRRRLRNSYETGIARAQLSADYHVGPGRAAIALRGLGRTGRACYRVALRRDRGRPPSSEAAELIGCVVQPVRNSRAIEAFRIRSSGA